MNRIAYGICKCGKWGKAPDTFKENKHFLKCECGQPMYLQYDNPREAGYPKKDMITTVGTMKQFG